MMRWITLIGLWTIAWSGLPLASLISLQTLRDALAILGYPAVILFIMIESTGIPFPGETMLLLASFYAATDHRLQIPFVILCAATGAIVGDNFGYFIGRKGGRPFVDRFGRYFFVKSHHLDHAERFFVKHGGKTVFFGRFTAILRTWAAFLAGVHKMHWPTFTLYNALGGIAWAIIYGLLGYVAGRVFHENFDQVEQFARTFGWATGGIVLAVVVIAIIFFVLRRQRQHKRTTQTEQQREHDLVS